MKKLYYFMWSFASLALLSSTLVLASVLWKNLMKQPTVGVTVFVHGTVGCSLKIIGDDFVCAFRNHPLLQEDQIIGETGLHEFNYEAADKRHAATHLIPVYDKVAHVAGITHDYNNYLVFGWSGLLSHEDRLKAAHDFYDELCDYRDKIKKLHGVEPVIRLIAHSHGGNVGLLLDCAEQEKRRNLKIKLLYMFGTPIQVETAPCISSKMFMQVMLGYSHGDGVQGNDSFSTRASKSYKQMSKLVDLDAFIRSNPGYIRCDMRYMINRNSKLVTHVNMWLMGRSKKLFEFVDPLSLVVFTPLFASAALHEPHVTRYIAHLDGKQGELGAYLTAGYKEDVRAQKIGKSENLYGLIAQAQGQVVAEWTATDRIRSLLFNRKNFTALRDAWIETRNKEQPKKNHKKEKV